jgi:Flp pilus assembly pilin Flp
MKMPALAWVVYFLRDEAGAIRDRIHLIAGAIALVVVSVVSALGGASLPERSPTSARARPEGELRDIANDG